MTVGVGPSYPYGNFFNHIDAVSKSKEINTQIEKVQEINNETSIIDQDRDNLKQSNKINDNQYKVDKQDSLEKFTFDFKRANDFNLVGAKSKVEDMDVDKALSDMKKDSVLDQYKFFVKSSLGKDEDGSVRIINDQTNHK